MEASGWILDLELELELAKGTASLSPKITKQSSGASTGDASRK
jgi:hypothetical protein